MKNNFYARVAEDGTIQGVQQTSVAPEDMPPEWKLVDEGVSSSSHYFVGDDLTAYTPSELAVMRAGPPLRGMVWSLPEKAWVEVRPLNAVKQAKLAEINKAFQVAAAGLMAGYPEAERLTWGVQQSEALAWSINESPTPYLDGLAAARGLDPLLMRQKTLAKVQAFMDASQALVGTRQRLEDAVNTAADASSLSTISWPKI